MKIKFEDGWIRTDGAFGPLPTLVHHNKDFAILHTRAYTNEKREAIPAIHTLVHLEKLHDSSFLNATILEEVTAANDWRAARAELIRKCDELAES